MTDAYKIIKNRSDKRTALANLRISLFHLDILYWFCSLVNYLAPSNSFSSVHFQLGILLILTALNTWRWICFWHTVTWWWWNPDLRFMCILSGFKISEKLTFKHTCCSQTRIQPWFKKKNATWLTVKPLLCADLNGLDWPTKRKETPWQPLLSECKIKNCQIFGGIIYRMYFKM